MRAFLRSGALLPKDVFVASRSQAKLDAILVDSPGIHVVNSAKLAAECSMIFVCVGAADLAAVFREIDQELSSEQLLIITNSTVPLKALEERVPCGTVKLIPSIAQEVDAGIALLMYGSRVDREDRILLEELLSHISRPIVIPESMARPVIGLTSGGPALIAYVLQMMADEAVRNNPDISPELARKLVEETATATMKLIAEANMPLDKIIRRVAVPGGMTEFSIEILSRYIPQAWQTLFQETAEREKKARESLAL